MILKGRQIFSHLEDTESLPAKLYELAIRHVTWHKDRDKTCSICEGLFKYLPKGFNKEDVYYERETVKVAQITDVRYKSMFDEELVQKIISQRIARDKKKKPREKREAHLPPRRLIITQIRKP